MQNEKDKFNPEYKFLNDSGIKELQLCLDSYVSGQTIEEKESAKVKFPEFLDAIMQECLNSTERAALLIQFLHLNTSMNYAGGIGKDINNVIVKSMAQASALLEKKYPGLYWKGSK